MNFGCLVVSPKKEVAPEIARQLQELKTTKIKVDLNTNKLEELLNNHKRELKKFVVITRWFLGLVAVVITWLVLQSIWLSFCLLENDNLQAKMVA